MNEKVIRRCLICGKEIPLGEDCYQIKRGVFVEENGSFVEEYIEGYAHETCLPLTPTM